MSIRAKMYVTAKTKIEPPYTEGYSLVLRPVIEGSEENKGFYAATPGGELMLQTVNPAVGEQLEVGQEAYIDITPIPMAQAAAEPPAAPTPDPEI